MGGKRWTDEENAQIAGLAEQALTATDNMHLFPGRTFFGVTMQASRIGVALSLHSGWEQWERDLLTRIYHGRESIKVAVHRLLPHRGYVAAKTEAARIGLTGTRPEGGRTGYSWIFRSIELQLDGGKRMTADDLAFAVGASGSATRQAIEREHGAKVRVGEWKRTRGFEHLTAMWELGSGPDAPRPVPLTSNQLNKRRWARKKEHARSSDPFSTIVQQVTA
jgi:hypothetical protein